MEEILFTSDLHFNHVTMVSPAHGGRGWRPFSTVEEMNECLIERWNSVVGVNSHVWLLGDVGMGSPEEFFPLVERLNGRKHLVSGNHDQVWDFHQRGYEHQATWLRFFETIHTTVRLKFGKHRSTEVLLFHLPYDNDHTLTTRYEPYRLRDREIPLLHGHVHDSWKLRRTPHKKTLQINVGVDVWDWTPVGLSQLLPVLRGQITDDDFVTGQASSSGTRSAPSLSEAPMSAQQPAS
jgi:calcineurin-like phosphoesterase family protein